MRTEEALALIRRPQEWNLWRDQHQFEKIPMLDGLDLSGAMLDGINLCEVELPRVNFRGASLVRALFVDAWLTEADLTGIQAQEAQFQASHLHLTRLDDADLRGANFMSTEFRGTYGRNANFSGARLYDAYVLPSDMEGANFRHAKLGMARLHLREAWQIDFSGSEFGYTVIADCDLSKAVGLDETLHETPSPISLSTILKFKDTLPERFLRGCGVSEREITYFRSVLANPLRFYTCFLSYSAPDEAFATRLHNDLQAAGVRCWKWNEDAKTGRPLWAEIDQAIRVYDKLVLIASESSLKSKPVEREIVRALDQENDRHKRELNGEDVDSNVLFTVRIDDYLFRWEHPRAADVRDKMVADACGWDKDNGKYQNVLNRLLRDLNP